MKMRLCWAVLSLAAISMLRPINASGAVSFSAGVQIGAASDFYDPLTSYGAWVQVGSYGRCWHPTVQLEAGWRPYGVGHWEWTDCGWYWVSDEPWAWACYHYGSWVFDPTYGWVWVPGTEWAPAWVVWRDSPDYSYIGWAPCGPSGVVVAPSWFCFIDVHHFHERISPGALIVNDTRIYQRTRVVSGIRREDRDFDGRRERVVVNSGPQVDRIQKVTGQAFRPQPVRDVVRSTPLPQPILQRAEPWRRQNARVVEDRSVGDRNRSGQQSPAQTPGVQERSGSQTQPTPREERNLTPSGREQPRTYQPSTQPAPKAPAKEVQPAPSTREERNLTPSGREQPRVYQQPAPKPAQPAPAKPEEKNVAPSGREQPRVYQQPTTPAPETPKQPSPPEPRSREQITPQQPPKPAAPERTLPPTGREERKYEEPPRATPTPPRAEPARPEHPETPVRPVERPERPPQADHGRDKDKDKDHP